MQNGEDYHCLDGYAQSMQAIILFIKSLAKKYESRSITAFSANPGSKYYSVSVNSADFDRYQDQCADVCYDRADRDMAAAEGDK